MLQASGRCCLSKVNVFRSRVVYKTDIQNRFDVKLCDAKYMYICVNAVHLEPRCKGILKFICLFLGSRIEGNQMEDRSTDRMWLVRHLEVTRQLVVEDLKVVKVGVPSI